MVDFFTFQGKCTGTAVGLESGKITDDQITSSSDSYHLYSSKGRLNGPEGWCPLSSFNRNDFLQVDMGSTHLICAVATQGVKHVSYVKSYKLMLSTDGITWTTYKEQEMDKVSTL